MTKLSYGEDSNFMLYTDESIDNPGYMYGTFDGDNIKAELSGTWNKEHILSCSQIKLDGQDTRPDSDTKNHATDLHNLRASCQDANVTYGNKFYDNENTDITLFPNIEGTPNSSHLYEGDFRGYIARILFCMATRYDFLELNDDCNIENDTSMSKLSTLLEWNELDPVDDFEIQRNNRIYQYQGNRNPYIDYPELASIVFGE